MTQLTVMTGWSPTGYVEYGREFVRTFEKYWPDSVNLVVYGEAECPLPINGEFRPLPQACREFIERHGPYAVKNGRVPTVGWKERDHKNGYSYRFDAVKFCRQGFIPLAAMDRCNTEFLLWLDGDVVTHAKVDPRALCALLPRNKSIAYLGREPKHPDIAFQLYRTDAEGARFVASLHNAYAEDSVFDMKEWHSAYVWRQCLIACDTPAQNLTPTGHGHVWFQSPLRAWMDHLKGTVRKEKGRSLERR